MYPVSQDFLDKMKADRRRVLARVEIDYTDPFMDQSIEIEVNEQANVSYPQQTADSVDPVSYTHLDVYKRQILALINTSFGVGTN